MKFKTLADLYLHLLRDIYYAENQLAKALPKMAKVCSDPDLKNILKSHLLETKVQSERLERVFESLSVPAKGEKCEAMDGLLLEAQSLIDQSATIEVRHAAIIAACQKVEHYEIGSYGTIIEIGKLLGHTDQVKILRDTLKEEKAADSALSALATGGLNRTALTGDTKIVKSEKDKGLKDKASKDKTSKDKI